MVCHKNVFHSECEPTQLQVGTEEFAKGGNQLACNFTTIHLQDKRDNYNVLLTAI